MEGHVLVDLNRVVVAGERSTVAVVHVHLVPVVHERILSWICGKVTAAQVHGGWIALGRAKASL